VRRAQEAVELGFRNVKVVQDGYNALALLMSLGAGA
jgi:hypothetical protein